MFIMYELLIRFQQRVFTLDNSKAFALDFLENLEELFSWYHMKSDTYILPFVKKNTVNN